MSDVYSCAYYLPQKQELSLNISAFYYGLKKFKRSYSTPHSDHSLGMRKNDLLSRVQQFFASPFDPQDLLYIGLQPARFFVDEERIERYAQATFEGKIPLDRANKHFQKIFLMATRRMVATVLAHENEHAYRGMKNNTLTIALTLVPVFASAALDSLLNDRETQQMVTLFGVLLGVVGYVAGLNLTERASFIAQEAFYHQFLDCVTINRETVEKNLFDEPIFPSIPSTVL
jgi:hypothetical protein